MARLPSQVNTDVAKITNQLATELASQLFPLQTLLDRYSLSKTQFKQLVNNPEFRQRYAQAKAEWGADKNATERVTNKATLMVEDSLLEIFGMVHDSEATTPSRLQAFNSLVDLSEVSPKKQKNQQDKLPEQFVINISTGDHVKQIKIDNTPKEIEGEVVDDTNE